MRNQSVLSAAVLLLAGCFSGFDSPAPHEVRPRRGNFVSGAVLTGELDAARGALITVPALPQWQTAIKWMATEGAEVQPGERVVELDNASFTADLDTKRQAETQATQELQQKEAEWLADSRDKELDVEKKRTEFEKAKLEARVPEEILSARDYQDRQMKQRRTEMEYRKSRDLYASQRKAVAADRANLVLKVQRAQREVATAERAIEALVLRAPRGGVVVIKDHPWEQRKLQNGDTVWVGFPIAMIPELDSLQIAAALPDVDDGRVSIGMPATITLDGYPGLRFSGSVNGISAVAQESKSGSLRRMFRVTVKLAQIDAARMRPGLSARVEIRRSTLRNVLLAPRGALDFSDKQPRARLASGKLVPVRLGDCNSQECVVMDGLTDQSRLGS
jgi:HlyD family secretion protein